MKRAPAVPMKVSFTSLPSPHLWRSVLAPPHLVGKSVLARSATTGWGRSSLRHLRQRHFGLLSEIPLIQLLDARESVDLLDRLVVADAHDARKAQREAAAVAARPLDRVESDLVPHPS